MSAPDGLLVVDKPAGLTSHDVVARVRRLAQTRKVGHAGTLDPMATGVLLLGIGRATRLLGHLALADKAYRATIRLGQSTTTDDADGELIAAVPAAGLDDVTVRTALEALTGDILQVPSSVSAIKVAGRRSYTRVRAGEEVVLPPRPVTVTDLVLLARRDVGSVVDLDILVSCSTGTYVRALARDLGVGLGVGGHLTALRRTRVGPYDLSQASTLEQCEDSLAVLALSTAAAAAFPRRDVDAGTAALVANGRFLDPSGVAGPVAVLGPDGAFLALYADTDGEARPVAVFVG